jgi:hypothetical protein
MCRTKIVEILREKINPKFWNSFWLVVPTTAILLLQVCFVFLRILGLLRFKVEGSGWVINLLMLFSITYGFLIGTAVLLVANKVEVLANLINKIKLLAIFAIVTPLFNCLILIWVFCC